MRIQKISSINYSNNHISKNYLNPQNNAVQTENRTISFGSWYCFWNRIKPTINPKSECFNAITNVRNLTPHILCGGLNNLFDCFYLGNTYHFLNLKKLGKIDTVIYFGEDDALTEKMQNYMKKIGLKHFALSMWGIDNWFAKENNKISIKPKYFEKLKSFLKILNSNDNVLMGCDFGIERTSRALFLHHFLSKNRPSGEQTLKCCIDVGDHTLLKNFKKAEKVFNALTEQQKAELGIVGRKLPKIDMADTDAAIKKLKEALLINTL